MQRRLKLIGLGLVVVMIVMQFIPVSRTNPPVESELTAPSGIAEILQRSCYDCHSNETRWPWYSYVAPVSWLVAHDVTEGREHLNFSTWGQMRPRKQAQLVEEIWEEVEEGEMPLRPYLIAHRGAQLSDADRHALHAWTQEYLQELELER